MESIGPYKVLGKLGEGGMGTVYRVLDPHAARHLAIKLIKAGDAQRTERFFREAESLARVSHPGVVKIHHLEREGRQPYLVLELVEGTLLEDMRTATPRQAAGLVRKLCDAVAAVHREGIVHRDLKPSNVIVRDGDPVLLDFGVARDQSADALTKTGALVGTLAYLPPEALSEGRREPEPTVDVYSLGVILYQLLMGRPPFEGSQVELIEMILHDEPVWPRSVRDDVEPELEQIVQHAMAKSPDARYATAEALRDDLASYLAGRRTEASRARRTRHRAAGLRVAVGICLLGAAAAVGIVLTHRTSTTTQSTSLGTPQATPANTTRAPSSRDLWTLEAGDHVAAAFTLNEQSGVVDYRFDSVLRGEVAARSDTKAVLKLELESLAAEIRLTESGGALRPASPTSPLSEVLKRCGGPIGFTVDVRTGAVLELTGLEAIRANVWGERAELERIASQLGGPEHGKPHIVGGLLTLFGEQYLGTVLTALLGVLDEQAPLAWQRSGRGDGRQRFFVRELDRRVLLPFRSAAVGEAFSNPTQASLEGEAVYERGRLSSSRLVQSSAASGHVVTWAWTLLEGQD